MFNPIKDYIFKIRYSLLSEFQISAKPCDKSNRLHSGRQPTLNEELLKETIKLNTRQSDRDLAQNSVSYSQMSTNISS